MMTLKESFQYSNFLNDVLTKTEIFFLSDSSFTTNKVRVHKKGKALNDDTIPDEVVQDDKSQYYGYTPIQVIDLIQDIIKEQDALQAAIDVAKYGTGFDRLVMINSKKRSALGCYLHMLEIKPTTKKDVGVDYKFNVEGTQLPYKYEVEEQISINFDRNQLRGLVRKLRKECEETSSKIDEIQLTKVEFEPKYCLGDSIFDMLESNNM